MLIFDSFPGMAHAESFARRVRDEYGLGASVHATRASSDAIDPFPFDLHPPIVLAERPEGINQLDDETAIERMVGAFGGVFAGT